MPPKSNRVKTSRFTEGPDGQEEWEKWFAEQPSSFQDTWDEHTDQYGDKFKAAGYGYRARGRMTSPSYIEAKYGGIDRYGVPFEAGEKVFYDPKSPKPFGYGKPDERFIAGDRGKKTWQEMKLLMEDEASHERDFGHLYASRGTPTYDAVDYRKSLSGLLKEVDEVKDEWRRKFDELEELKEKRYAYHLSGRQGFTGSNFDLVVFGNGSMVMSKAGGGKVYEGSDIQEVLRIMSRYEDVEYAFV